MEDCEHLFRYCGEARAIWRATADSIPTTHLDNLGWEDWLEANLQGDTRLGFEKGWPERFSIRIWWLWKWRNDKVLNGQSIPTAHKIRWISQKEAEITTAFSKANVLFPNASQWGDVHVSWSKPSMGLIKVNVDGSVSSIGGKAGCGGVIRDHDGRWKGGFMASIGVCSIDEAEAWAVWHGLRFAISQGHRHILLESDSRTIIDLLRTAAVPTGAYANLIERCRVEMARLQSVEFQHVFREQNRVADALAKQATLSPGNFTELGDLPAELCNLVSDDQTGVSFIRRVPMHGAIVNT